MSNLGQPKVTFSDREDEVIKANWETHTRAAIGAMIGRSVDAVKRRGRLLGLTPGSSSVRRIGDPRRPEAPARTQPMRFNRDTSKDAELIAEFLATRGVTVLPSGPAAGLSPIEGQFWSARPSSGNWKAQQEQENKNKGTFR